MMIKNPPYKIHGNSKHDLTIINLFHQCYELTRSDIKEKTGIHITRIDEVLTRMEIHNLLKWRDKSQHKYGTGRPVRYYRLSSL